MFYLIESWSGAGKQRRLLGATEGTPAEAD
jgi:hypothetical protein